MAKRKHSPKLPQLRSVKKSTPSQFDKRSRLLKPNPLRQKTTQAKVPLIGSMAVMIQAIQSLLDQRIAFRLPIIMAGAMLAKGRRTASSWFRFAGVKDDWDCFYNTLTSIGKSVASLASPLLRIIAKRLDPGPGNFWTIAIDDSPTKRYGRCVEGANVHHNPTPGPADGDWLFGHCFVCAALVARHGSWGVIALPILSFLYVRQCDIPKLDAKYPWKFETKHQLALRLVQLIVQCLRDLGTQAGFRVVFDGAYAAGPLIKPLVQSGITVISRLRRDAKLTDLPPARQASKRGRPRKYGLNRIDLKKRAEHPQGWTSTSYVCRGGAVLRRYKTFMATTTIADDPILVVIVEFNNGEWAAYFSTDTNIATEQLLETIADRWSIEEAFHDTKEIWGAGKQQVRNIWSNIGCWNLNGWLYSLVELATWDEDQAALVDRSDRPWDNAERRPSHADRRRSIARKMLEKRFFAEFEASPQTSKIRELWTDLLSLAA